jgi:quercetin dioxygenase-like cupin family protein
VSSPLTETTPVRLPKAWGYEEVWALVPGKYCGKRLHVDAGCRLSLQYHQYKDETMMLESGEAYLLLGETLSQLERIDLKPGASVHVPVGWVHRLCAITDTVVLEVSTTELDDVFRMDDDYGR